MCSRPRNPQRKPKPKATELSGSKKNDESLSRSFSSASRNSVCSCASTVYSPAKTMGLISSNPGSGSIAGRSSSVIVSPILVSATFLRLAKRNPTSPARSSSTSTGLGVRTPSVSTSDTCPFDQSRIFCPRRIVPSNMRVNTTTPRYGSNHESKIKP